MNISKTQFQDNCFHTPSGRIHPVTIWADFLCNRRQLIDAENMTATCDACGTQLRVPVQFFSPWKKTLMMLICFFTCVSGISLCFLAGILNKWVAVIVSLLATYCISSFVEAAVDAFVFTMFPWISVESPKGEAYTELRCDRYREAIYASKRRGVLLGLMFFLSAVDCSIFAGFYLLMELIALSIRQQQRLILHIGSVLLCGVLLTVWALCAPESVIFVKIIYFVLYVVIDLAVQQCVDPA